CFRRRTSWRKWFWQTDSPRSTSTSPWAAVGSSHRKIARRSWRTMSCANARHSSIPPGWAWTSGKRGSPPASCPCKSGLGVEEWRIEGMRKSQAWLGHGLKADLDQLQLPDCQRSPEMLDFDQVIAPFTRAEFLAEHWNKSFLFKKGEAGRFTNLLAWDE